MPAECAAVVLMNKAKSWSRGTAKSSDSSQTEIMLSCYMDSAVKLFVVDNDSEKRQEVLKRAASQGWCNNWFDS